MKPIFATITGLVLTTALVAPATAQNRPESVPTRGQLCVVNEFNGRVVCGRRATEREIRRYNREHGRDQYEDNYSNRERRQRVKERIRNIYQEILGRNPDRNELRTYSSRVLSREWNIVRVRRDLAYSGETRDRINQIYRETLRRDADRREIQNYQQALERGWSLEQIRVELENSREARGINRRPRIRVDF